MGSIRGQCRRLTLIVDYSRDKQSQQTLPDIEIAKEGPEQSGGLEKLRDNGGIR